MKRKDIVEHNLGIQTKGLFTLVSVAKIKFFVSFDGQKTTRHICVSFSCLFIFIGDFQSIMDINHECGSSSSELIVLRP